MQDAAGQMCSSKHLTLETSEHVYNEIDYFKH